MVYCKIMTCATCGSLHNSFLILMLQNYPTLLPKASHVGQIDPINQNDQIDYDLNQNDQIDHDLDQMDQIDHHLDKRDQIDHDLDQIDQINQIDDLDHDLGQIDQINQIDQIDHDLDQMDHDLDHLPPSLPFMRCCTPRKVVLRGICRLCGSHPAYMS